MTKFTTNKKKSEKEKEPEKLVRFPHPSLLPRRGAQGVIGQKWLDDSTQRFLGVITLPQAPSSSFSAPVSLAGSPPQKKNKIKSFKAKIPEHLRGNFT